MNKLSFITLLMLQAVLQVSMGQEAAVCSVQPQCIVPQPVAQLRETSLEEVVRDVQCEIGCIEEVGFVLSVFY